MVVFSGNTGKYSIKERLKVFFPFIKVSLECMTVKGGLLRLFHISCSQVQKHDEREKEERVLG